MIATDRTGQSIIESCLAIFIICLIFVGIFQVAQIHAAREILHHSAARAARAKTVGFNQWMVRKVARVAAIPNAGRMTCPFSSFSDPQIQAAASNSVPGQLWMDVLSGALVPPDTQVNIEIARIPEYLWCPTPAQALNTLDYTNWNSVAIQDLTASGPQIVSPIAHLRASQDFQLTVPAHRAFYASDQIRLEGECYLDNHYPIYIDDRNW